MRRAVSLYAPPTPVLPLTSLRCFAQIAQKGASLTLLMRKTKGYKFLKETQGCFPEKEIMSGNELQQERRNSRNNMSLCSLHTLVCRSPGLPGLGLLQFAALAVSLICICIWTPQKVFVLPTGYNIVSCNLLPEPQSVLKRHFFCLL